MKSPLILLVIIILSGCGQKKANVSDSNHTRVPFDTTEMLDKYSTLINTNSNDADAFYQRGLLFLEMKKYEDAISDFNRALDLDPQFAEAYNERGNAKFRGNIFSSEDTGWAWADYQKAIDINPKFAKAYYDRGTAHNLIENNMPATSGCADICKALELGYPVKNNSCDCSPY